MTMGERIKAARKAAGLTQAELGEKVGVAAITIRQYESGKRNPNIGQLIKIAKGLDISFLCLIDAEELTADNVIYADPEDEAIVNYFLSHPTIEEPKEQGISMADFTYAFQNEVATLTDKDKELLLSMAKQLNEARKAAQNSLDSISPENK